MYVFGRIVECLFIGTFYFCSVRKSSRGWKANLNIRTIHININNTMKNVITLVLFVLVSITTYATTNNGLDKGKKKKRAAAEAAMFSVIEEEPAMYAAGILTDNKSEMNVKVFDVTGKIVFEKKVKIESILSSKYKLDELPKRSVFVMFHNNTAYYFQEEVK